MIDEIMSGVSFIPQPALGNRIRYRYASGDAVWKIVAPGYSAISDKSIAIGRQMDTLRKLAEHWCFIETAVIWPHYQQCRSVGRMNRLFA